MKRAILIAAGGFAAAGCAELGIDLPGGVLGAPDESTAAAGLSKASWNRTPCVSGPWGRTMPT